MSNEMKGFRILIDAIAFAFTGPENWKGMTLFGIPCDEFPDEQIRVLIKRGWGLNEFVKMLKRQIQLCRPDGCTGLYGQSIDGGLEKIAPLYSA